jgi:hypothetical protein
MNKKTKQGIERPKTITQCGADFAEKYSIVTK